MTLTKKKITIGDTGASCQDQQRNNRITFPYALNYGFQMAKPRAILDER